MRCIVLPAGSTWDGKKSKQTRWKRLLDVFISLSWICLVICVWTEHMLYIKYQGLFMFGLELLKQPRAHETHSDLFSTAQYSVSGTFSNRILTWYTTLWNVNTDGWWGAQRLRIWSQSSLFPKPPWDAALSRSGFYSLLAKMQFPSKANLTEIVQLISDNSECMMRLEACAEWWVWIFVFIYPGDKVQVLWYRWCLRGSLCHDQVKVRVSCMSEGCIAPSASFTHSNVHKTCKEDERNDFISGQYSLI